jgi:hypothetical protein
MVNGQAAKGPSEPRSFSDWMGDAQDNRKYGTREDKETEQGEERCKRHVEVNPDFDSHAYCPKKLQEPEAVPYAAPQP